MVSLDTFVTADWGRSCRAEILQILLVAKVASCDTATFKITELYSMVHSTAIVCLWTMHGYVLDFMRL